MSNPTSMQMFQQDVQNDLVGGFLSFPEPEPEEQPHEDETEDNAGTDVEAN